MRAIEIVPLKVISCEENLMSAMLECNNAVLEKTISSSYPAPNYNLQTQIATKNIEEAIRELTLSQP